MEEKKAKEDQGARGASQLRPPAKLAGCLTIDD